MRKPLFVFSLLTLAAATGSLAGISVDHDKSVDFSKYGTFTIRQATEPVSPLMRQRLIQAIEVQLGADGLEKVEEGADLHVVIHVAIGTEKVIRADSWGYGGHPGWGGWGGWGTTTVNVRDVSVGTLLLDIVDTASNQLVWRGVATDSLPKKSEKLEKKIYKTVDKLFRHFPPEE